MYQMTFVQTYLPYGLVKYKDWWIPFNREYNMLGIPLSKGARHAYRLRDGIVDDELKPFLDFYLADDNKYELTEKFILKLSENNENLIRRDNDGNIVMFYLYDGNAFPYDSAAEWKAYCNKLLELNKFSIKHRNKH